jgi:hypothetical protein
MSAQIESTFPEVAREGYRKLAALMQQGIPEHWCSFAYGSLVQETDDPVEVPLDEVKIGNVRGIGLCVGPYLDRDGLDGAYYHVTRQAPQALDVDLRSYLVMHPKVQRLRFGHDGLYPFDGDLNTLTEAFSRDKRPMEDALWEVLGEGSAVRAEYELKHAFEKQRVFTREFDSGSDMPFQVDSLPLRFGPDSKLRDDGLPEFIEPLTVHPVEVGVRTKRNPEWEAALYGVAILTKGKPVWRFLKGKELQNEGQPKNFFANRSSLDEGVDVEFAVVNGIGKFYWQSVRSYHVHAPENVKVVFYRRQVP